jgi:hypothetical protein
MTNLQTIGTQPPPQANRAASPAPRVVHKTTSTRSLKTAQPEFIKGIEWRDERPQREWLKCSLYAEHLVKNGCTPGNHKGECCYVRASGSWGIFKNCKLRKNMGYDEYLTRESELLMEFTTKKLQATYWPEEDWIPVEYGSS